MNAPRDPEEIIGVVFDGEWTVCRALPVEWRLRSEEAQSKGLKLHSDSLFNLDEVGEIALKKTDSRVGVTQDQIFAWSSPNLPISDLPWLQILVNIPDKLFINGYFDLPLETQLPENWHGRFADPIEMLPESLKCWWEPCFTLAKRKDRSLTQRLRSWSRFWGLLK